MKSLTTPVRSEQGDPKHVTGRASCQADWRSTPCNSAT
jgi:hypothetical protein